MEAAVWWVNPHGSTPAVDTVEEDMAAFGVEGFVLPEWMREEQHHDAADDGSFGVLPDNWEAVNLFVSRCATLWRRDRRGVPVGLRYADLDVVLRRSGCDQPDLVFEQLQVMEHTAVVEYEKLAKRTD